MWSELSIIENKLGGQTVVPPTGVFDDPKRNQLCGAEENEMQCRQNRRISTNGAPP